MSAEIINLRRARKTKAKAEKEKTAEANRVLHGTPRHCGTWPGPRRTRRTKPCPATGWKKAEIKNKWDFQSPRSKIVLMPSDFVRAP